MVCRPTERREAGFTLAEVMVVVHIIGILLSVAVPTFPGARNRAADAVAFTELRTAANTAYPLSNFGTDFTAATPAALTLAEPSLEFTSGSMASSSAGVVSVDASSSTQWSATVLSSSGRCLGVVLRADGGSYYDSTTCRANSTSNEWPGSEGYVAPPPPPAIEGQAGYVGVVPDTTSFSPNQEFRSDDELFVFFESALVLEADLRVGQTTIPAGTSVCSHIVWYDPGSTASVAAPSTSVHPSSWVQVGPTNCGRPICSLSPA